ncbi:MAG: PilZ domain-containing protein [Pyrinomonadaceae bacterium]
MDSKKESRRRRERMRIALPAIVQSKENAETEWSELTRLLDVTPFGASFSSSHLIEVGRLVHMTLPMPRQMRCFDHTADQYKVWALVRYVKPLPESAAVLAKKGEKFAIGVAFVGKNPPEGHKAQPSKFYDANLQDDSSSKLGIRSDITRKDAGGGEATRQELREGTRLGMPVDVILEVIAYDGSISALREQTVTENISRRGASVFTALDVAKGTRVRLTSAHHQISINAFVLGRRVGADGLPRLHLKFAGEQWPLDGIV